MLNVAVSFGCKSEGMFGLSIENGALIVGASSISGLPLQFWITTRWPLSSLRWTTTLPKSSAGGAIAPPLSMKWAVSIVVAVGEPSTSVVHVIVSVSVVRACCGFGVTATTADWPGARSVGNIAGEVGESSNGDGVPASAGVSSAIVAVPVDCSAMLDCVVGWLMQNVPMSSI